MRRPPGPTTLQRARELRRFGTEAEKRLWSYLRGRRLDGRKFRRQVWIGNYVADFFCAEARLIIEADGGQHGEQLDYDARRTAFLEREGFRVIRFWNNDVLENPDGVVTLIREALTLPSGSAGRAPPSPLQGEGL
jgi:very-short-patch-repair endonuclease